MKLKIINVDSNSEKESDYETAVDMSHSSIYNTELRLMTLSGLELHFSYIHLCLWSFPMMKNGLQAGGKMNECPSWSQSLAMKVSMM